MSLLLKGRKKIFKDQFQWFIEIFNDSCLYMACILHMQFLIEPENLSALETSAAKTIFGKATMYLIMLNFGGNISTVIGGVLVEIIHTVKGLIKDCQK